MTDSAVVRPGDPQSTIQGRRGRRSLRELDDRAKGRERSNRLMSVVLTTSMVVAIVPLVLILFVVAREGAGVIQAQFFTEVQPPPRREGGGYLHGFVGTAYIMAMAVLMSVPLGIAAAIYLVEYGGGPLALVVRFFTDVMTGVPSVFVGLFVFSVLVVGTGGFGFGTLVAAVAIGIVMLPIVVRSCEGMLKLVPDTLRAGSAALGARKWQTTTSVVLPSAAPGMATGVMLAVARGAGETAPLILTALGSLSLVTRLQGEPQASLTLLIYRGSTQPFAPGIERAWGGALCLLVLTLLFTVAARIVGSRFTARSA